MSISTAALRSSLFSFNGSASSLIGKGALLVVAGVIGTAGITEGASATLDAVAFNTIPQDISGGILKLEATERGDGFTQPIQKIAPGDTVNRFVEYKNSGDLAGKSLSVSALDTSLTSTLLTTSAVKGLQVTITRCSNVGGTAAWTSAGVCETAAHVAGTTTDVLVSTPITSVIASAQSLISTMAVDEVASLKFSIVLPDQAETTTNGVLPSPTVQGAAALLQFKLREIQRDASTTNS